MSSASTPHGSRTRTTLRAIEEFELPKFLVMVRDAASFAVPPECGVAAAADWMKAQNVRILNVAGHRESVMPGMEIWVERYMRALIERLRA